jgi:hypothetical protein
MILLSLAVSVFCLTMLSLLVVAGAAGLLPPAQKRR